ncbi:hypothetical protein [Cellulosimicrobium sp. Marseille-Q4280]|uniref:hypothetical protein n=1 Tax=Cellulosimicrobium sp. Marseille-Q4280 TaxID=2937992 RepID=UPI00203A7F2C|nr:hypothetical protein [Cellulosimicrobium sp. Marseille-Q4280]
MRCTSCRKKADPALSVQRFGGGSYKRPGRFYPTTICETCAIRAIAFVESVIADDRKPPSKVDGVSVFSIRQAMSRLANSRQNAVAGPTEGA